VVDIPPRIAKPAACKVFLKGFPMRALILSVALSLASLTSVAAQTTPGIFSSYEDMRSQMDPLLERLQIGAMMELFVEVPPAEQQNIMATEIQMQGMLPTPLSQADIIRVQEFENGYRQELIVFTDGATGYLYVRLVLHERPDGSIAALRFGVNTDIDRLMVMF